MKISAKKQRPVALCAFLTGDKLCNSLLTRQLMRVSGIVSILLSTTFGLLLANSGKGQDMSTEKVAIGLRYESLTTGLEKIERQTNFRFFYRKADIKALKSLNLPVRVRTVQETLNELLYNTFFSFRQIDGSILLEKNHQQTGYVVNGRVVDINQQALPFATVSLIQLDINKSIQTIQTDTSGNFKLTASKKGDYLVKIYALGMDSLSVSFSLADNKVIQLPDITLTTSSTRLKEVVVTASKPLIKQEIDRLTYNVQSDPEKDILSVLELLRKVPLVSVTGDDKIEVKGNTNFRILINGRPSSLVANNPSDVFRAMPANTIQSIEVITNPPSKYDAEGIAGIINVITNKKIEQGYNASLGTTYNTLNQRGLNGSLTLKIDKIGINGFFGSNWQDNPPATFKNSQLGTSFINTLLTEQGRMTNSRNARYGNVEISYEIDSLNLITGTVDLNNSNNIQ